jgi:hypothetical protein
MTRLPCGRTRRGHGPLPKIEYSRLFGEIGWAGVNRRVISAKKGQALQLSPKKSRLVGRSNARGGPGACPVIASARKARSNPGMRV